ncbi:AAA domain-containing protein [Aquibacillus halophilus]|uniref:AAA domain-containing protein n=1 Tax=Aquibacillus halophilus TaxID=930132 RepID=A0A6A8D747_9BACI|nr:AAA family ATPase [Aquibacillus halophilus]MRH41575.1 AAA domain-containing protein [Aquibacillus halophilus]
MEFTKLISRSEAKYYISKDDNMIKPGGGGQSSYNLPSDFLEEAINKNVLKQDQDIDYVKKSENGAAYVLTEEYSFRLGLGVIWLIGEEYNNEKNKFIGSLGSSNNKFQLYKVVYNKLDKEAYSWFVKLYDKNLAGNKLLLHIDVTNKVLTLDVMFNGVSSSVEYKQLKAEDGVKEPTEDYLKKLPHNRIVFGAPGTGKSFTLEEDKAVFGDNFERVTFHPNYSYAQFVGTYKPVPTKEMVNQNGEVTDAQTITYKYVPGPFMRTYVKAIRSLKENDSKSYLLLIEEINRANVAAVFGDVFQLLDRKDGESEYVIETSEDMRVYLAAEFNGEESQFTRIRIPKNMYIWATMNSADQGVFPMDTAFKRRWNFEYVGINENAEKIKDVTVKLGVDKHEVNWNNLRMAINDKLSNECRVNEDKLLGPYFLAKDVIRTAKGSYLVDNNKAFINAFKSKVLMYLYEEFGKQYKHILFEGCKDYSKYSSVCEEFEKVGEAIFGRDVTSKSVVGSTNVDEE